MDTRSMFSFDDLEHESSSDMGEDKVKGGMEEVPRRWGALTTVSPLAKNRSRTTLRSPYLTRRVRRGQLVSPSASASR